MFKRHPGCAIQRLAIGAEEAPLLVIDNLVADPDSLVELAAAKTFGDVASYYPGVRAKVPLTFQQFVLKEFGQDFSATFGLGTGALRFTACHFSLVTTPPDQLTYLQRIPHVDSLNGHELASILYLFKKDLGGTSFYRHRKTGFESVDHARQPEYWRHVEAEQAAVMGTAGGYIDGDTEFYQRVGHQEAVYNRMLVYRRTSLHSGALNAQSVAETDPRRGRLSINGFLA